MITGKQLADAAVAAIPMGITYQQEMCDAFVRNSFKRAGGDMGRYAGSNDMFRNALTKVAPLNTASGKEFLVPGALLFIVEPGHNAKYGDEMGDASHVGIYTADPKAEVMHSSASRGGVFPSTLKNAWTHVGLAKAATYGWSQTGDVKEIDYGGRGGELDVSESEQKVLYRVVLPEANRGQTVNMRKNPQPDSVVYEKVPDGTQLLAGAEFTRDGQVWREVRYNSMTGYMMAQYLEEVDGSDYTPTKPTPIAPDANMSDRVRVLEDWVQILLDETGVGKRYGGK